MKPVFALSISKANKLLNQDKLNAQSLLFQHPATLCISPGLFFDVFLSLVIANLLRIFLAVHKLRTGLCLTITFLLLACFILSWC